MAVEKTLVSLFDITEIVFEQNLENYHQKSYDKSVMAHMTFYALRQKFHLHKPQLRFGFVNETFVFGHKTSYWAITL